MDEASKYFAVGDSICDARDGRPNWGTVTSLKGRFVYFRCSCMFCRDGLHHRTYVGQAGIYRKASP
ncbi:hypothetical protein ACFY9G_22965 [Streptomyces anthocyanicus]|uniref:hypothetical protein n=1 Tax=Streptomyces anthocyanicus TaxID=68174 RepID=UPI0036E74E23